MAEREDDGAAFRLVRIIKRHLVDWWCQRAELVAEASVLSALQEPQLKEVHDFQERFTEQIQSYTEIEVKLQSEINLRTKAETSTASAEEKASVLEGKLSHLSESIEREKGNLNNDLAHIRRESNLSAARITADLERMECRAQNAEKESQLLKGQLDNLKNKLNECLQHKSEAETTLSRLTFQEVTNTDNDILVKHLQEELRNFETDVRAARKLKSSHEDVKLLEEKLREEKGCRERELSQSYSKLQEFQLSMKKLMTKNIPGVSRCDDIPVKFGALQKEVVDSTKREGEATARLKQLEVALDAALNGKQTAESEAELMRAKLEVTKSEADKMLSRVTEERDKLRNDINEFKRVKSEGAGDEASSRTLLEKLESSLEKKEGYIKELDSALYEQKQVISCQHEEIKLLNDRLKTEARKVKSLEREGDQLRSEISLLESKLGHGDFSAANTKVLRMVNTLIVDNEAKQTIEALRTERQKTKERLQAVEELKSQSGESGKWVDSDISGKIVQLKEQIATLEKT
ncbi:LOW QUALITY PROTEIN: mitotic spindle checkpoint protein MAD1 [Argentina anserina]|uniref:LOW QUALITY PROTEIN: mitotic spindle checkpoint protein MAD1 n=1 Tax=Argentina anserina TaxID=57926 RepID=UPI00217660A9|nr:LOW QUALITY PROTEIN: mitotic spindle checkpoint protein MAD1 [Potentilla anserina]